MVKWPGFAPAWQLLIDLAEGNGARLDVIDRALAAGPSDETRAHWQINKALALNVAGDSDGAVKLLQAIGSDPRSNAATLAKVKMVAAMLSR